MSGTRTVLLIEDEPTAPASTIAVLLTTNPDFAVVDYNLPDGPCLPVIAKLKEARGFSSLLE